MAHQDQKYIDGLKDNNNLLINQIYKLFVPKVIKHIQQNNGSYDEAQDVVQEVLITIYNQAVIKNMQLTCPFDAYFFLLCKRRWLNVLSSSGKKKVTNIDDDTSILKDELDLVNETDELNERQKIFDEKFKLLSEKCKTLLQLSFITKTLEEVAEKLQVTYAYVRKKKSLCTGELSQMIKNHPNYQLN
jgi:RNA polymerase sigma factor (sigma-70 family)